MNSRILITLQQIYNHLPLFAEEGGEAETVDIRRTLSDSVDEKAVLETSIQLIERIFVSAGLLETSMLEYGLWRFQSFPASLMARSLLSTLLDFQQPIFPNGFWGAHNPYSDASEAQRDVLATFETQRQRNHPNQPKPIRYVHVAWCLIYIDGQFLLRHREDKNRKNESNYVLVGGKVTQHDLMVADKALKVNDAVRLIQSPEASNCLKGIQVGLYREMTEETGLEQGVHYDYSHWRTLKPYTNVGGAGAVRAITEYHIHVYHIELNQDGMLALSKRIRSDENLVWFTSTDMVRAQSQDGKMAYIPALIEDFKTENDWNSAISDIPPSYDTAINNLSDAFSVTIPLENEDDVQIGKTGKEKPLSCDLTKEEHNLLLSLSLNVKGRNVHAKSESVQLLNNGWVEIIDNELNSVARELTNKLHEAEVPIVEGYKERYYRLALPKGSVYFQTNAFTYCIEDRSEKKTQIIVTRGEIATDLVKSEKDSYTKEIAGALKVGLHELIEGKSVGGNTQKDLDTFKKNLQRLRSSNQRIGLRGLVRSVDSNFKLVIDAE